MKLGGWESGRRDAMRYDLRYEIYDLRYEMDDLRFQSRLMI